MKYVIDTSVEIKTFRLETDSAKAIRLRDEYRMGIHELLAPDLFPTEVRNVLMILERFGKIKPGEANQFFLRFLKEVPPLHDALPLLPRALDIAQQFRQSVYDILYAALAEQEGCEHVTPFPSRLFPLLEVLGGQDKIRSRAVNVRPPFPCKEI